MSTDDALEDQRRVIGAAVGDVAVSPDLSVIVDSFGHEITQSMQTFSTFFIAGRYTGDILPDHKIRLWRNAMGRSILVMKRT
jgi:hypothetical protein